MKTYITLVVFVAFVLLLSSCTHWKKIPDFSWPVKKPFHISRKFSIYHEGIDFPKNTGSPVLAIAKGKVVYAGNRFSGYGNMIIIKHSHYWSSLYAHLHTMRVKTGHAIQQNHIIGTVGNTGRSSGPHLHFEILYAKQPINPVLVLPNNTP